MGWWTHHKFLHNTLFFFLSKEVNLEQDMRTTIRLPVHKKYLKAKMCISEVQKSKYTKLITDSTITVPQRNQTRDSLSHVITA